MTIPHLLNLALHVGAGAVAIGVGFVVLARTKGDSAHRRLGRRFVALTSIVVATAAAGLALFRWMPVFALLTLLVGYQLASGWRAAITRDAGPTRWDFALTVVAVALTPFLAQAALDDDGVSRAVVFGSCGGLATVVCYDVARWLAPQRWRVAAWRYEHLYKMNAALFGMISAFIGNTVRAWQPWSQLLPSAIGVLAILVQAWRLARATR